VRVDTGDGDDSFDNRAAAPVRVQGGIGDFSGSNRLFGRGGGDSVQTELGSDTNDDRIAGGAGADDIDGGPGSDHLAEHSVDRS
jgi:Ca2+-binding RTX toxin-like protein